MATVLLLEDNADVREMMATALKLAGHTVVPAADGSEALRLLKDGLRPRLILLDLMMPVMDGWAFRAALEQDPALTRIPVVVVSAVGDDMLEKVRAAAHVPKPIDIDHLLEIVGANSHSN